MSLTSRKCCACGRTEHSRSRRYHVADSDLERDFAERGWHTFELVGAALCPQCTKDVRAPARVASVPRIGTSPVG